MATSPAKVRNPRDGPGTRPYVPTVTYTWQRTGRSGIAEAAALLCQWQVPGTHASGLHVGDVGWHARLPDPELDGTVRTLLDGDEVLALGLFEPGLVRSRTAPGHGEDEHLADALAREAWDCRDPSGAVEVDVDPGSALAAELARQDWRLGAPWVVGYLAFDDPDHLKDVDDGARPVDPRSDVQHRVDVQRASFERSSFTVEAHQRMSACAAYDSSLDVVAYDRQGRPVAAATAWSAGPGRCGILEPVGTHRDHRGQGHGRRAVLAAARALAATGASGIAVATPASNTAAVAAYRTYGLQPVEERRPMIPPM